MKESMQSFPHLEEREFKRLASYIQGSVGIKMPQHKRGLLELRLSKRIRALGLSSFEEYCACVFDSGDCACELQELIDAVTTNKTEFFREPAHFTALTDNALPDLLLRYPELQTGSELRVWSAGCSSGEEPYSLAMVLADFVENGCGNLSFRITASDLCATMLRVASQAVYPCDGTGSVPPPLAKKYLLKGKGRYDGCVRVAPHIRRRVDFYRMNLVDDYPLRGTFDIIFCPNVLIYFERDTQTDILGRMCNLLADGGYLFVGHSETLHAMGLPLTHIKPTVYRRASRT